MIITWSKIGAIFAPLNADNEIVNCEIWYFQKLQKQQEDKDRKINLLIERVKHLKGTVSNSPIISSPLLEANCRSSAGKEAERTPRGQEKKNR